MATSDERNAALNALAFEWAGVDGADRQFLGRNGLNVYVPLGATDPALNGAPCACMRALTNVAWE